MASEAVALYRNEEKHLEVEIKADPENVISPFAEEDWLSFPTSTKCEYAYGTERVAPEILRDRADEARQQGGIAIPVSIRAESHVILTAGNADDEGRPSQYGFLIVTAEGLKAVGLDREKAIREAKRTLESYNEWANGHSWRCVTYEVTQCNLGHWHRTEPEAHGGYVGGEYEETGILEDAGIQSGSPPSMNPGWGKVTVPRDLQY